MLLVLFEFFITCAYVNINTTACPIKGQIRKSCAPHSSCMKKCNATEGDGPCLTVCVVDGCVCPDGTVINEEINECVTPSQCTLKGSK